MGDRYGCLFGEWINASIPSHHESDGLRFLPPGWLAFALKLEDFIEVHLQVLGQTGKEVRGGVFHTESYLSLLGRFVAGSPISSKRWVSSHTLSPSSSAKRPKETSPRR